MKSYKKSRVLKFLAVLALVMAACAITTAENDDEFLEKKEVLTTLEQRMLKRISIDFRNTPIDDVIRIMAEQADVDIVKSPKVIGNVTATLTDVPLEEALNNILASHGYGYVVDENMIRIAPIEEIALKAEMLVSRIYRITYTDVKEVETALKKFVSARGSLSSNPSTSNIIVTDSESKMKAIDKFIEEIDRITPQILVEVRIYDITTQETLDLGVEWQAGRSTVYGVGSSGTTDGEGLITGLGTNPASGLTEPFVTGLFSNPTSETGSSNSGILRLGWFNPSTDIDAVLKAQQEIISAKLLANPRILVLDNETALFDIVREIPYTETTTTGNTATETVVFKNIGVRLEVTPHVTRGGMLRLHIKPEFGVLVSQHATTLVPTVDTRKLNTIALIKDGQTVVLGGLRKKDVSHQLNKIPLLGDLPLAGALFRFEGEDTTVTELVVFITPRIIIEQPVMAEDELRAYEKTEFGGPKVPLTRAEKAEE